MAVATVNGLKVVSRVYARADGARAVLSYRETADGRHRVSQTGQEEPAVWPCPSIEGARERWLQLTRSLKSNGFKLAGYAR